MPLRDRPGPRHMGIALPRTGDGPEAIAVLGKDHRHFGAEEVGGPLPGSFRRQPVEGIEVGLRVGPGIHLQGGDAHEITGR